MPDIIIVAGPNGAGKTSFANEYLPYEREGLVFLNADEIARELQTSGNAPDSVEIAAGRLMLQRMDASISAGLELMFETTLATRLSTSDSFVAACGLFCQLDLFAASQRRSCN